MRFETTRLGGGYLLTIFYADDMTSEYAFTDLTDMIEFLRVNIAHEPDEEEE